MNTHDNDVVLRAAGISKSYGGARAIEDVSFDLRRREIHALLGENGAGKSTFIKTLSGSVQPDTGTLEINGRTLSGLTPSSAAQNGVGTVFQELSLVPQLSIADNIHLGNEEVQRGLLAKKEMVEKAAAALARVGMDIDPRRRVAGLSRAQMQLIEIARVLYRRSPILILDEPTASLSQGESAHLLEILQELRGQGIGIIYISHRLAEIRSLAQRVTVLRDGRKVSTLALADVSDDALVEMMAGRSLEQLFPDIPTQPGRVRLRLSHVTNKLLRDVSLEVRAGEIVGVAGLVGDGKSEIGRACFGLDPVHSGSIEIDGVPLRRPSPREAMRRGLMYYPADRKEEGLVPTATLAENIMLAPIAAGRASRAGFIDRRGAAARTEEVIDALRIRPAEPGRRIRWFSGGNQQKALLARSFAREFAVHVFDEPTVGIDIGAKADVYQHVKALAESGSAVLLISSDTEEILGISHRIVVVRSGRVVAELRGQDKTEENVVHAFFATDDTSMTPGGEPLDRSA